MKYIALLILTMWAICMLNYLSDIKPSQNLFMWLTGVFTMFYLLWNGIGLMIEAFDNKRHSND